jgi:hypothetical protein
MKDNDSDDNGDDDSDDDSSGGGLSSLMGGGPMDSMGGSGSSGMMGDAGMAAMAAAKGAVVPGQPKYNKDTTKNDTVPAMLTPKEIVLPLSVTQAKDPAMAAAKFVAELKKKEGKNFAKGGMVQDDFKAALQRHQKNRRSK